MLQFKEQTDMTQVQSTQVEITPDETRASVHFHGFQYDDFGRSGELLPFLHVCALVSKETWCLTSTETIKLIRDGEGGMEVGEEGD